MAMGASLVSSLIGEHVVRSSHSAYLCTTLAASLLCVKLHPQDHFRTIFLLLIHFSPTLLVFTRVFLKDMNYVYSLYISDALHRT